MCAGRGKQPPSSGKGCPFFLCHFKLFMSGQWKEYSKIKNALGPGIPWILVWWKQPREEERLRALCPGVGWASNGLWWLGAGGCFPASAILPVLKEPGLNCAGPGARPGDGGSCARSRVLHSGKNAPGRSQQPTTPCSPLPPPNHLQTC